MSSRDLRTDTGISVSFIASAVIHMAVFLLLAWWGRLFPIHQEILETYYVDVVNLPVADPISGNPAQKVSEPETVVPPPPPPSKTVSPLSKAALKAAAKPVKVQAPQESDATESSFSERMAKLEKNSEARREEAVFEKLRNRVKAVNKPKAGVPGTAGNDAGSRYVDYVKSRLEEALKITSSYTTKNPEVAVRLAVAADGRLLRMKIERSSGDAAFELAVRRAIDLASEKFTAPPNGTVFENGFVFKPKGISHDKPR